MIIIINRLDLFCLLTSTWPQVVGELTELADADAPKAHISDGSFMNRHRPWHHHLQ